MKNGYSASRAVGLCALLLSEDYALRGLAAEDIVRQNEHTDIQGLLSRGKWRTEWKALSMSRDARTWFVAQVASTGLLRPAGSLCKQPHQPLRAAADFEARLWCRGLLVAEACLRNGIGWRVPLKTCTALFTIHIGSHRVD